MVRLRGPWQRIHIDYAGPFLGTMFFVTVDAYSKCLEVLPMNNMSEKTLDNLRTLFTWYGYPRSGYLITGPSLQPATYRDLWWEMELSI